MKFYLSVLSTAGRSVMPQHPQFALAMP